MGKRKGSKGKKQTSVMKGIATPSPPSANVSRLFVDSGTGELSVKTSAGVVKPLTVPEPDKPHGHFEGVNWVWPNGQKTHVRFIDIAIRKMKPLPRGFYEEAEKETYLTNMKNMLRKAKQLKLPDSVDIRNDS